MQGPWWESAPTAPLPTGDYSAEDGAYGGGGQYPWRPGPGQVPAGRRRPRRRHRFLRRVLIMILAVFLLGALVFTGLLLVTPSVRNAPEIARRMAEAHHEIYPGPVVPRRFAQSLVSTEDHRFYGEPGIDPLAVGRVVAGRVTGRPDQGGATLYQQLAKMLYTPGRSGLLVQAEQAILGIKLSLTYSKADILRMYADVAYFGHGYYGLPQAACGYFGKAPSALSWPQASMLAGLVQAPSAYDPLVSYRAARARQAHVLDRLRATGVLSAAQAARAYRQPLHLSGGPARGCAAG